jgi:alkyldihydroxyacetonephosphate synthase
MNNNETPRETLSKRKPLRFWGWGYDHEELTTDETQLIDAMVKTFFPVDLTEVSEPQLDEFDLRPPRFDIPANLSHLLSSSTYDRLVHSYGKSFADTARMFMREVPNPPDAVAFPESEEDISAIMEFAQTNNIAVIPFGGGTSVCGGVEADVGDQYQGTITVDMERFNKIFHVICATTL